MTPDDDCSNRPRMVIVEVLPNGWIAKCAGTRIMYLDQGLRGTSAGMSRVGDVIAVRSDSGWEFNDPAVAASTGQLTIGYQDLGADLTKSMIPLLRAVQEPVHREKPYLAMNEAPWQKRKKGRRY